MANKETRRGAERLKQDFAVRQLRRVATMCPSGIANEILRNVRREHRETTQEERILVRDVRDRGGVCFPGGMTQEEWRNRLPRSLRGSKSRCVPPDELAQELYDRGTLPDASSDTVLDRLGQAHLRASSAPPRPTDKELVKQAKKVLNEQIMRAAKELVATARRQGLTDCPAAKTPEKEKAKMSGIRLEGG
jgi:hypothetical protein